MQANDPTLKKIWKKITNWDLFLHLSFSPWIGHFHCQLHSRLFRFLAIKSSEFKNSWSLFPSLLLLISFASKALNVSMWLICLQALVGDHMTCWNFLQFVFLWDVYILGTFHCPWKAHICITHIVHLHHPLVTPTIVLSKCYNTSHIPRKLDPFKNCRS
jgi:hypothetical protein